MKAQLIEDMPFADYLQHPALSASGMKRLLDSPARFQWERENPTETAAMIHGRLIHAIAFDQPHDAVVKDWDARTTAGKARRDEVLAEQGVESVDDLNLVSADDWDVAEGIAKAVKANPLASSILRPEGVRHEVSAFWIDPESGIEMKCRFDALSDCIGDLKSTTKAKPDLFVKDSASYGYFVSAPHYRAGALACGLGELPFYLVAAEKRRPHFLSICGISEVDLELGERLRRKAIGIYVDCMERNHWPDYTHEIAYPEAPSWWRYMAEEMTGLYDLELTL